MRWFVLVLVFLSLLVEAGELEVRDGYVREIIPGQTRTAAFFTVDNKTGGDCRLIGASSTSAVKLEIHQHRHHQGMMQMRKVPALTIPSGEVVVLRPGEYHLMLMGVSKPLMAGKSLDVVFDFDSCGSIQSEFPVRSLKAPN